MKKWIPVAVLALALGDSAGAFAATKVVTTTQDLESLAKGYQDPHFVEAKPSFILKLHAADLLIVVGRELEIGWLPPLINQSRNSRIQPNGDRYLDASLTAKILEIPTGQVTRAMGDVHPSGNPHYWLAPDNGRRIAQAIQKKLTEISPADAAYFAQRYADFDRRLGEAEKRWTSAMAPYKGVKVVTYHRSWPNFTDAFGLNVIGYVEPKPGIPPSPSHTLELIQEMKRQQVKVIMIEPYFDRKTPDAIARETGAQVIVLAPSVGGDKDVTDYFKLFDHNVNLVVNAIKQSGTK
jgi:ABC-type Zn uptake system ZnuABC Zn-binding protein ZnuA